MGIKKISINISKELASADEIRINVNCVKPGELKKNSPGKSNSSDDTSPVLSDEKPENIKEAVG